MAGDPNSLRAIWVEPLEVQLEFLRPTLVNDRLKMLAGT